MAKTTVRCYVCRHPKRREIDKALKDGVTQSEIVKTLCPGLKNSLQHHWAEDHHLQEPGKDWTPTKTPIKTKQTSKASTTRQTMRTKADSGEIVKVHWELPRELLKKLKHEAVDREVPTVQLVRELLEERL